MPNGISHPYHLDESISILMVVEWYFHFCSKLNGAFRTQTVETLIRCRIPRRLIWVYTVCLCPTTKRTLGLYGLTTANSTHLIATSTYTVGFQLNSLAEQASLNHIWFNTMLIGLYMVIFIRLIFILNMDAFTWTLQFVANVYN